MRISKKNKKKLECKLEIKSVVNFSVTLIDLCLVSAISV